MYKLMNQIMNTSASLFKRCLIIVTSLLLQSYESIDLSGHIIIKDDCLQINDGRLIKAFDLSTKDVCSQIVDESPLIFLGGLCLETMHADLNINPELKDYFDTYPIIGQIKWKQAFDLEIIPVIRRNTAFIDVLRRFPYGFTSKRILLEQATDQDFIQIFSGALKKGPDVDPVLSDRLINKFGPQTKTEVIHRTDPSRKEFDAITSDILVEHKRLETTSGTVGVESRDQIKYHMKACEIIGKDAFFMFEGLYNQNWINSVINQANAYMINTKIEYEGTIIHDLVF